MKVDGFITERRAPRYFDFGPFGFFIGNNPNLLAGARAITVAWPRGEATFDPSALVQRLSTFCRDAEPDIQRSLMPSVTRLQQSWALAETVDSERHNIGRALKYFNSLSCKFDSDKLAILSNVCRYKRNINIKQAEALGIGFSVCVLTLALMNGDETLICKDDSHRMENTQGPRAVKRNPLEIVPKQWAVSWMLPMAIRLDDGLCTRDLRKQATGGLTPRGLKVKGWAWRVTEFLDLEPLQEHFKNSEVQGSRTPDPAGSDSQRRSFWWSFLTYLAQSGFKATAEALWQVLRPDIESIARENGTLELPSTALSAVLDFDSGEFIPPTFVTPNGQKRTLTDKETFGLLASGYMDMIDWIRVSSLQNGGIWVGVLANNTSTANTDPAERVFLSDVAVGHGDPLPTIISRCIVPYMSTHESNLVFGYGLDKSKSMWSRKMVRTRPLAWVGILTSGNTANTLGKTCNCIFSHDSVPASTMYLAWPEEMVDEDVVDDIEAAGSLTSPEEYESSDTEGLVIVSNSYQELDRPMPSKSLDAKLSLRPLSFKTIMALPSPAPRTSSFLSLKQHLEADDKVHYAFADWMQEVIDSNPEHASLLRAQEYIPHELPSRIRRWSEQLSNAKNTMATLTPLAREGGSRLQRHFYKDGNLLKKVAGGVQNWMNGPIEALK